MSKKVLLEQLRRLAPDGLVGRRKHLKFPPEVGCFLTEKGYSLIPVLVVIDEWAACHLPEQTIQRPAPSAQSCQAGGTSSQPGADFNGRPNV